MFWHNRKTIIYMSLDTNMRPYEFVHGLAACKKHTQYIPQLFLIAHLIIVNTSIRRPKITTGPHIYFLKKF